MGSELSCSASTRNSTRYIEAVAIIGLSNPRAVTRVPDPIHGVIELTVFDRDIVDSKAFQRLHFVLQQSVSYTSFPSNKNTRFPHSLGTAHTAGRMFSAALSNAAPDTLAEFLNDAARFIGRLALHVSASSGGLGRERNDQYINDIDPFLSAHKLTISGASGFRHSPLSIVSRDLVERNNGWRKETYDTIETSAGTISSGFVIDTIWQAIRIYALTHDIGHLPMSHAFENAISNTPRTLRENFPDSTSEEEFTDLRTKARRAFSGLERATDEGRFFELLDKMLDADREIVEAQVQRKPLHEVRSFSILNKLLTKGSPLSDGFPKLSNKLRNELDLYSRLVGNLALCIIYSRSVVETAKDRTDIHPAAFLYAIRQLVDGTVDGDRLDYTLRDCHSAGTRFGDFDLERIIGNCVLLRRPGQRPRGDFDPTPTPRREKKDSIDLVPCSLYAFGFGPQALPGIEQFFEARYQSYKYLVHHRTASRSNIAMEVLIAHLFAFSAEAPDSDLARIMERFRYIKLEGNRISDVLPVFSEAIEEIDDASLRTLLHQVRILVKSDDFKSSFAEERRLFDFCSIIQSLCEVVLFRDFRHIITLFRDQTPTSVICDNLNLPSEEADNFRRDIEENISEFMTKVRRASHDYQAMGLGSPVVIMHEQVSPKVYKNQSDVISPFEHETWLMDPRGHEVSVGDVDVSPQLANMDSNRKGDSKFRLYAVGENLRKRELAVSTLEELVIKQLRLWRN